MDIKSLFTKPLDRSINGVVKADQTDQAVVYQELDEYVVTNELEQHFRQFFESYTTALNDPSIANRVGVWINGFFGSGKSHFLKILSYILANKEIENTDGQLKNAVSFFDANKLKDAMIRADIDKAVRHSADVILFNIDSKANAGDHDNAILNVFLRVFNEHQGFSGDHPHIAHMERHLTEKNVYEQFKTAFEQSSGVSWVDERDAFHFYQDDIEEALTQTLGLSNEAAHKWFEESETTFGVSVESFCKWVQEYLETQPAEHRVLFLVDEVGQFIGSDTKLMLTLQTITENLGTICKGRAWIVVTSQADMDAIIGDMPSSKVNDFSKIAGRFKTRLSLSSSNTDEVIQKRLLHKTPEAQQALEQIYDQKGEILKNQFSFDRSGPTLRNYSGPDSFVSHYPFVPYHFQLVQKIFEEIRKVGATGAHLAYGERSMLDAFQEAAKAISSEEVGALVPLYRFYPAIEGFLDTAVKRTIDQAKDNTSLHEFDVKMLRTLFMIRYVDLIKGTADNLVTLFIETIDEDKIPLRKTINESLQRLEKENLIIRNGEEFLFLTNEERDITQKIKATDISSSEENKKLSELLFKEVLKDQNKYRYQLNKVDYSIGRFMDGHPVDGKYETDLKIEIISPFDADYTDLNESRAVQKTAGESQALFKLADDRQLFADLKMWLRTDKYIRINNDPSQTDVARILAERGRENRDRLNRIKHQLEALFLNAEVYALGQKLNLNQNNVNARWAEACQYLLENTYSKLDFMDHFHQEPWREINAVLTADDLGQLSLSLDGEKANTRAEQEVQEYIKLRSLDNDPIYCYEVTERFTQRPYGWPEAEIILIMCRLAKTDLVHFSNNNTTLACRDAYSVLQDKSKRRLVKILATRKTDDSLLKSARKLTQDLFSQMGPAIEKELYDFCVDQFEVWRNNLTVYKNKIEVGHYPGKKLVDTSLPKLEYLLKSANSFDFFKAMNDKKNDLLDLEEDYRDLHEFFTKQQHVWEQLQKALRAFKQNEAVLNKDDAAQKALAELKAIAQAESPYNKLQQVPMLVQQLEAINNALLNDKRAEAEAQLGLKVQQLETEIT
ncbi:MAG TPA: BREX system P-loop protein BrxC, partial [Gammaproteobacteria bacterium]|nr:BREX system P-loop protein BrxC [Gammaproteobacteria bacterium]